MVVQSKKLFYFMLENYNITLEIQLDEAQQFPFPISYTSYLEHQRETFVLQ